MANMYFIACVLPTAINEKIVEWKLFMKTHFKCLVALRSPAHVTLVPPFWMNIELENKLRKLIDEFSQKQASLEMQLENFGAFKPRVIYVEVVHNEALRTLHGQLQEHIIASQLLAVKKDDREFHPHVTIATRDLPKKSFHEAWDIFKNKHYSASCIINGISLLRHNQKNWDVVFTSQFSN